jgi:hypothetical protein
MRAPADANLPLMAGRGRLKHRIGDRAAHEQRIGQIAARQQLLITHSQLLTVGLTRRMVGTRADDGRLHRLHIGVYAINPPPHAVRQRWMAAVLACGEGAALCGLSSAALQEIAEIPTRQIHVRSPKRSGRGLTGIAVHRGVVDPRDLRFFDGIPCVSADLALVDLARSLDEPHLEMILVAAESKGYLKRERLGELISERRGRPGIPKLESLLELEPAIVRSDPEVLMLPIARMAGLRRPKVNFPIVVPGLERPLVVDYAWPEIRMVVEADSQRFHGDWERARADRERDQLLALAGWRCHRFTRDRFEAQSWMAERLARLAAVGGGRVTGSGSARGGR